MLDLSKKQTSVIGLVQLHVAFFSSMPPSAFLLS